MTRSLDGCNHLPWRSVEQRSAPTTSAASRKKEEEGVITRICGVTNLLVIGRGPLCKCFRQLSLTKLSKEEFINFGWTPGRHIATLPPTKVQGWTWVLEQVPDFFPVVRMVRMCACYVPQANQDDSQQQKSNWKVGGAKSAEVCPGFFRSPINSGGWEPMQGNLFVKMKIS